MTRLVHALAFGLLAGMLSMPSFAEESVRTSPPASDETLSLAQDQIEEGREFRRVLPVQPTSVPPGQVEVLEFFWYGCPHCYRAEKHINEWLETKPENVVFRRIPATLSRGWALMAHAYYAAEQLNVLETMHDALFAAFHVEPQMLGSEERLAAFFKEKAGVDEAAFRDAFNSPAVSSRVQHADMLARRYRISGVPSMIVNGKFQTDPEQARGYHAMIKTVDTLAAWELQQQDE